jgi:hypothetical protein
MHDKLTAYSAARLDAEKKADTYFVELEALKVGRCRLTLSNPR